MRYIVSGEFTKIDETSGTIQNTSKINVVEVSDTNEKGSGIMLYPLEKFTFGKSLYARCVDGGGAEVRVVPFEVDAQGGVGSSTVVTVPGGGGSGIAFAGMILGTESSTVDGGLWYDFDDGLPVVKINYSGGEFLIDTKPAEDALIGDVLYLGEHRFKLTGFADGLTFSDNNFYVGGNSTPIGSVSNYAFQFGSESALDVADGGTISITQLDTDTINYSLDLEALKTDATPWTFVNRANGEYVYTTGSSTYKRVTNTEYSTDSSADTPQYTLTLKLAADLEPYMDTNKYPGRDGWFNFNNALNDGTAFSAADFPQVTVIENYNNGKLTGFDVTINNEDALKNGSEWRSNITATVAPVNNSDANNLPTPTYTIQLADGVATRGEETHGSLSYANGIHTFTQDTYKTGFKQVTDTDGNTKLEYQSVSTQIGGDWCTITGLASNLTYVRTAPYTFDLYVGDAKVGTIVRGRITITDRRAFANYEENKTATATITDTQSGGTDNTQTYLRYQFLLDNTVKGEDVTEGFTRQDDGSYKYHTGNTAWKFTVQNADDLGDSTNTSTITYTPDQTIEVFGNKNLDLKITGLGITESELALDANGNIKTTGGTTIGTFDKFSRIIDVGTGGGFVGGNYYTLADAGYPPIILGGNNDYSLAGNSPLKTYVQPYSDSNNIDFGVDTYFIGYTVSDGGKTATHYGKGVSYRRIYLTPPNEYTDYVDNFGRNATAIYWRPEGNEDDSGDILFCEFNGQDWVLNSHAFDGVTTSDTINITSYVNSTPLNFDIELATDADTLAISRTFANETFTAGATAGTYTYTATGSTAGWDISADGTKIASWEFNGKTFTIENLRTDLGTIGFDSQGYIHATNGSTIGRMGGNVIKLYDTAVHKLATPILTGADAADFTLILPS